MTKQIRQVHLHLLQQWLAPLALAFNVEFTRCDVGDITMRHKLRC